MIIIYGTNEEIVNSYIFTMFFDSKFEIINYEKNDEKLTSKLFQTSLINENSYNLVIIKNATFLTTNNDNLISQIIDMNKEIVCTLITPSTPKFNQLIFKNKIKPIKATKMSKNNIQHFCLNLMNKYPINFDCETTKSWFLNECPLDPWLAYNEVKKLHTYSITESVTIEIIQDLIFQNLNDNIFNLASYIIRNDQKKALLLLKQLYLKKIQFPNILGVLATTFFDIKILKLAQLKLQTNNPIILAKKLEKPFFIINNLLEISNKITLKNVDNVLSNLLNIDYNIKSNFKIDELEIKKIILKGLTYEYK